MIDLEKKQRIQKGFTLVELIMSIGIIAILSCMVLQLFITAENLNKRSSDLDASVMKSESLIESFKSCNNPMEFVNQDAMRGAVEHKDGKDVSFLLYYDDKWNLIKKDSSNTMAAFTIKLKLYQIDSEQFWKIKISVIKNKYRYLEKNVGKDFYSIEASKYF